ncbi:YceI family protein [Alteromonas oceanisediminis]|uniref:YceI family protein n=1 Tax=Alteromonas oceanisediminis TaxID=2836180 RepID=UPI002023A9B3|nr:YceI family protein [Alteromonas oceanisediminis]
MSAPFATANTINASDANSTLIFRGEHAGMRFEGKFDNWQATLVLPPADNPQITATFDLGSAKTGDRTYDSTLPEGDWFDTENHPQGRFTSTAIKTTSKGYAITGDLTLRGVTNPVSFELMNDAENAMTATIRVDRLAFDIGKESDPDAEWVSREIELDLTITD